MNKKLRSVFLVTSLILPALSGCGREPIPDRWSISSPEIAGVTQNGEIPSSTQASGEIAAEPTAEPRSDFDFEKTLEQTYICGHQLSYPLTLRKLGEDFSVDPEGAYSGKPGSEKISCSVEYKGQYLGIFIFKGCESVDNITPDTEISYAFILSEDAEKFDVPKISVNGVNFSDNHEDLFEALGDSYEIGIDETQIAYIDDKQHFNFGFGKSDNTNDMLASVSIVF